MVGGFRPAFKAYPALQAAGCLHTQGSMWAATRADRRLAAEYKQTPPQVPAGSRQADLFRIVRPTLLPSRLRASVVLAARAVGVGVALVAFAAAVVSASAPAVDSMPALAFAGASVAALRRGGATLGWLLAAEAGPPAIETGAGLPVLSRITGAVVLQAFLRHGRAAWRRMGIHPAESNPACCNPQHSRVHRHASSQQGCTGAGPPLLACTATR